MRVWLRLLTSVYHVMRWLVLTILIGGLLIGVVIFGPLASLVTTGKPQATDPRSWLSTQWILAHLTLSVLLILVILGLFGLSWLAYRATSSEAPQSATPTQESGNRFQRWLSRLRYLPHHRIPVIVIALDAIYHLMAWIIGAIIFGGFIIGAIVDFFRWAAAGLLASVTVFDVARQDAILQDFIADPHYWTRRESLAALAKMMGSGFRPSQALAAQVIARCEDIEPEVRWEAILCLHALQEMSRGATPEYPTAAIARALNGRLDDPDRQVSELVESLLAPALVTRDGSPGDA